MHYALSSKNSAAGISWRYLGLGIALLAVLIVSLAVIEIPSFSSQPSSNQTDVRGNKTNSNGSLQVQLEIELPARVDSNQFQTSQGTTAFKLLNSSYQVDYKQYEQGYFVTAINGVKQNKTHSWLYFVNGQPPSQAVDEYELNEGDKVSFRYLSQKESQKYFQ